MVNVIRRLGAVLALGAVLSGAAQAGVVGRFGAWTAFQENGLSGVATSFGEGGMLSLLMRDGRVALALRNPRWRLAAGRAVEVRMTIDGAAPFVMRAEAVGTDLLAAPIDDANVLRVVVTGRTAEIVVRGERWRADLRGSGDATRQSLPPLLDV